MAGYVRTPTAGGPTPPGNGGETAAETRKIAPFRRFLAFPGRPPV
jgi:hypothetical protein